MLNLMIKKGGSTRMLPALLIALFSVACSSGSDSSKQSTAASDTLQETVSIDQGYVLLKGYCYSCHSPNSTSHDDILAPPMVAVKKRYLMAYPDKDSFVNSMTKFMMTPTKEDALMTEAVSRFNIMPAMSIGEDHLEKIITYIYENKMEQPEWFEEHQKKMHDAKAKRQPKGKRMN